LKKSKPVFSVQVRELIEFSLRTGDLGGGGEFVGSNRALEGVRGHNRVQRSRPSGYEKEITVQRDIETEEFTLRIRGRIDGLLTGPDEVLLEEIKTVSGAWDGMADPLHWAQAKFYGFMYADDRSLNSVSVQLTYLNLETEGLKEFRNVFSHAQLSSFFQETTAIYLDWILEHFHWCHQRDQSIKSLPFPFSPYRKGQREMAVKAYKTITRGGNLFIEAPTGIGKTISVIFPAVKALGEGGLERFFYLTARTIGRSVAETAFANLREAGLQIRTVSLTAKEKLCMRDGHACEVTTCPLAQGYYDRCKPAIRAGLNRQTITRAVLEELAREYQVCPFELSLDISLWVDAVICDYNYVFDPKVYLRRHFAEEPVNYAFLVDEAHNLVDRAREMFSAELSIKELTDVKRATRSALPRFARALTKLISEIKKLKGGAESEAHELDSPGADMDLFSTKKMTPLNPSTSGGVIRREGGRTATTFKQFPQDLTPPLERTIEIAEEWLTQNQPTEFRDGLLQIYFQLYAFQRTAELYDERFVTLVEQGELERIKLFCLDPSALLQKALARGRSAILFSATLSPIDYFRELLGGKEEDPVLQLNSPFVPEHLAVLVHDQVRTDFKSRGQTLEEVAQAIATLVRERSGNYLVYFPSFQYLNAVVEQFQQLQTSIPILVQRPGMSEFEREAFLAMFSVEQGRTLVGFAVLGGIFGEGIDLIGDRLIGAIVVGTGLPQLSVERGMIQDYFQRKEGRGFDYAYTFPGMNRVLQATGRVIRSEKDRGVVMLIDARFAESRYRRLFPKWWIPQRVGDEQAIQAAVQDFWQRGS
jgi:DNA excision repair protein ERCC-2